MKKAMLSYDERRSTFDNVMKLIRRTYPDADNYGPSKDRTCYIVLNAKNVQIGSIKNEELSKMWGSDESLVSVDQAVS